MEGEAGEAGNSETQAQGQEKKELQLDVQSMDGGLEECAYTPKSPLKYHAYA